MNFRIYPVTTNEKWFCEDSIEKSIHSFNKKTKMKTRLLKFRITSSLLLAMLLFSGMNVFSQAVNDYRSAASTNWNVLSTWQRWNGTAWVTPTAGEGTPTSADGAITIQSIHTVTVTANVTVDQVTVDAGGKVTVNNVTLTIANGTGTDFNTNGTLEVTGGSGALNTTGTLAFGSGATYIHNRNGGSIPTATWNAASNCNITGITNTVPTVSTFGQAFGNVTWNSTSQTGDLSLIGNLDDINGNLTITNTGSGSVRLSNSGVTATLELTGNFSQTAGEFYIGGTGGSNTWTVNVGGDFSVTGGTFNLAGGGGTTTMNITGDFTHTAGTITESSSANTTFVFNGGTTQTYTSGGTVSNTVNFTVNSGTTLQMAAAGTTLTGGGTFTLSSGATLGITSPNGITTVGTASGNIQTTGGRSFNAGANYTYNGSGAQNTGTGFPNNLTGNLTINNTGGTVTLSAGRTIANGGDIFLNSGTFAAGTNLTMASTSTINRSEGSMTGNPQGAGVYNVVYTGNNKTTGSELNGSGLNNISVNVSSGQIVTLGAAVIMDGAMTISSGATLDASGSNFAINIAGNWTNNGGTFNGQAGTVTFNGAGAQSINGSATAQTFSNVVVNKTAGQLLNTGGSTTTLTTNALTLTQGNFTAPATLNINGTLTHTTGTYTTGANTNVGGNWTRNGGTFTPGTNTVTFNGSSAQLINGSNTTGFYNLTINESAAATTVTSQTTAFTVGNNLTVTQGNLILQATNADYTVANNFTVATNGTFTHSVNWDVSGRLFRVGGNFSVDGVYTFTVRSHAQMTGTAKTLKTGTAPGSALSILTLSGATVTANGTVTVNDNFWAPFGTTGSFSTNGQAVAANAALLIAGGTVNVNGGSLTVAGGVNVGSGTTASGTLNVSSGSFVTDGITLGDATATVASSIAQSGGTFTVNGGVTINQPAANTLTNVWNINAQTATVSGLISFAGTNATASRIGRIVITTGTLNANGGISFAGTTPATKVIDLTGGAATINLKGALTTPTAATLLGGTAGSIFNYNDNVAAQTVGFFGAGSYQNLHINNTSTNGATLASAITAGNTTGNLRVQSGILNNGGFAITGNASRALEVVNGATLQIAGTTSAFPTGFGTVTLGNSSTVDYRGSGNQTVASQGYGNLTITQNGSRTVTLSNSSTIGIAGIFSPDAISTTYVNTGNTVNFNGTSGNQNIPAFAFNNLHIENAAGVTLTGNVSVNGTTAALNFINGRINTGANTITLASNVTVVGANATNYVNGNQAWVIPSGSSVRTFVIGSSSGYAPIEFSVDGVTSTTGTVTASTTGNDHPNIATSGLNANLSVNRFWTLTPNGITPATPTYDAVFTFNNPADLDPGVTVSNLAARKYDGSTWGTTIIANQTSTQTAVVALTGFGDFQLGEGCVAPTINTPSVTNVSCNGGADGSIDITTTGGSTPFTYLWSNGATSEDIAGLTAGTYSLTITANGGCTVSSGTITVNQPAVLNATVNSTNITCNSANDGTITISSPTGGNGTYGYSINGGASWQGSGSFTALTPGTYDVRIRDGLFNSCEVILNASLTLTEPSAIPAPVSGGDQTVCTDGNPLQTLTASATSAFSIIWYDQSSGGSIVPTPTQVGPGSVTYWAEANDGSCSSLTRTSVTLTINTAPATPGAISGPLDACPLVNTNTVVTYSISPVAGATSYTWTVPVGVTIVAGQGTTSLDVTFDNTFALTNSFFTVTATNAVGCTSAASSLEVLKIVPGIPAVINGPTDACPFAGQPTNATYSIAPVPNATSYTWTVSGNATLVSGQGTTSIQVSFASNYTAGNIRVTANSNCGNRSPRQLSVSRQLPTAPVSISGATDACPYIGTPTQVTYSIAPVANAVSYTWTVPANVTLVSGQGTTSINVTFNTGFVSSNIKVKSVSNCFTSGDRQLLVTGSTYNAPGSITGPLNACAFIGTANEATYTIRKVTNAPAYIWTVPAGATITSHPGGAGVNDTIITVSYDNSFVSGSSILVQTAGCVTSTARSITISRILPSTPGLIAGPTNVCEFMDSPGNPGGTTVTYTIRKVANATSYTWTAPANATITGHPGGAGVNDTIVEVNFSSSFTTGTFNVYCENACGTSGVRNLNVTKLSPGTPSFIDVIQTSACPARVYTYTLAFMPTNSTSIVWTIPPTGTLVSGQGTTSITVSYTSSAISGSVTATAVNNCDQSVTRFVNIKLPPCFGGKAANDNSVESATSPVKADVSGLQVNVFPNPSVSDFKVEVLSALKQIVKARVLDMQGRELKRVNIQIGQVNTLGSDLKAGNYILEITQGEKTITQKLIKL
jgi:hypothetical protein